MRRVWCVRCAYASAIVILFVFSVITSANANTFEDTFGVSARIKAMGGAGTTVSANSAAVYYNPAALAFTEFVELNATCEFVRHDLYCRSAGMKLDKISTPSDIYHFSAGVSGPVISKYRCPKCNKPRYRLDSKCPSCGDPTSPVTPWYKRIHIGAIFSQSIKHVATMQLTTATGVELPKFPLYGTRTEKTTIMAGLGVHIFKWLAIGGGATISAAIVAKTYVQLSILAATTQPVMLGVDADVDIVIAPHAGIMFEPLNGLRIGGAFRDECFNDMEAYNSTITNIAGIITPVRIRFDSVSWYTPMQAAGGVSYSFSPFTDASLTVAADVTWYRWSNYPGCYTRLTVLEAPGGLLQGSNVLPPRFEDTFMPRAGVEFRFLKYWAVRLGYAYYFSPAPDSILKFDLLDCNHHAGTFGAGFEKGPGKSGERTIGIDFAVQAHYLLNRKSIRIDSTADYPVLRYGGLIIEASITVIFRFNMVASPETVDKSDAKIKILW